MAILPGFIKHMLLNSLNESDVIKQNCQELLKEASAENRGLNENGTVPSRYDLLERSKSPMSGKALAADVR